MEDLFDVSGDDIVLRLHVQPGAGRTAVVGRHGDSLKVRVAAPPQDGRANEAVVALAASVFGVEPSRVALTSGESSRAKRVRIESMGADEAARHLDDALVAGTSAPGRKTTGRESQGPRIR